MKIIIFGGTGMLGRYVASILKIYYDIECINRDSFDILNDNWDKLSNLLGKLNNYDVVINCAGIIPQRLPNNTSNVSNTSNIPNVNIIKMYFRVNSMFPHKLQELSGKIGFRFIHITTDCVFNGKRNYGSYNELDNKLENMEQGVYGISKSLGEPMQACIIRTSIIGEEKENKKSLLEWVKSQNNGVINGFSNHYWNGITCLTLANIIEKIIRKELFWKGIRHIYSPEIISKYDLCNMINDIYQLNIEIKYISTPKKYNKSLISIYNTCNNFYIPSIREQLTKQKQFILTI